MPKRLIFMLAALAGNCGGGAANPPPETPPLYRRSPVDDAQPISQVSVGFQWTLDPVHPTERRIKLMAVVHDTNGQRSTTELGTYDGEVTGIKPVGNELSRVLIRSKKTTRTVRLMPGAGELEVRDAESDLLIKRIPIPAGKPVRSLPPTQTPTPSP